MPKSVIDPAPVSQDSNTGAGAEHIARHLSSLSTHDKSQLGSASTPSSHIGRLSKIAPLVDPQIATNGEISVPSHASQASTANSVPLGSQAGPTASQNSTTASTPLKDHDERLDKDHLSRPAAPTWTGASQLVIASLRRSSTRSQSPQRKDSVIRKSSFAHGPAEGRRISTGSATSTSQPGPASGGAGTKSKPHKLVGANRQRRRIATKWHIAAVIYVAGIGAHFAPWSRPWNAILFYGVDAAVLGTFLVSISFCLLSAIFGELAASAIPPFSGGFYGYSRLVLPPALSFVLGMVETVNSILMTSSSIIDASQYLSASSSDSRGWSETLSAAMFALLLYILSSTLLMFLLSRLRSAQEIQTGVESQPPGSPQHSPTHRSSVTPASPDPSPSHQNAGAGAQAAHESITTPPRPGRQSTWYFFFWRLILIAAALQFGLLLIYYCGSLNYSLRSSSSHALASESLEIGKIYSSSLFVRTLKTLPFAVWWYMGIETVLPIVADDAVDPRRELGRGALLAVALLFANALLTLLATVGFNSDEKLSSVAGPSHPLSRGLSFTFYSSETFTSGTSVETAAARISQICVIILSLLSTMYSSIRQFSALIDAGMFPLSFSSSFAWCYPSTSETFTLERKFSIRGLLSRRETDVISRRESVRSKRDPSSPSVLKTDTTHVEHDEDAHPRIETGFAQSKKFHSRASLGEQPATELVVEHAQRGSTHSVATVNTKAGAGQDVSSGTASKAALMFGAGAYPIAIVFNFVAGYLWVVLILVVSKFVDPGDVGSENVFSASTPETVQFTISSLCGLLIYLTAAITYIRLRIKQQVTRSGSGTGGAIGMLFAPSQNFFSFVLGIPGAALCLVIFFIILVLHFVCTPVVSSLIAVLILVGFFGVCYLYYMTSGQKYLAISAIEKRQRILFLGARYLLRMEEIRKMLFTYCQQEKNTEILECWSVVGKLKAEAKIAILARELHTGFGAESAHAARRDTWLRGIFKGKLTEQEYRKQTLVFFRSFVLFNDQFVRLNAPKQVNIGHTMMFLFQKILVESMPTFIESLEVAADPNLQIEEQRPKSTLPARWDDNSDNSDMNHSAVHGEHAGLRDNRLGNSYPASSVQSNVVAGTMLQAETHAVHIASTASAPEVKAGSNMDDQSAAGAGRNPHHQGLHSGGPPEIPVAPGPPLQIAHEDSHTKMPGPVLESADLTSITTSQSAEPVGAPNNGNNHSQNMLARMPSSGSLLSDTTSTATLSGVLVRKSSVVSVSSLPPPLILRSVPSAGNTLAAGEITSAKVSSRIVRRSTMSSPTNTAGLQEGSPANMVDPVRTASLADDVVHTQQGKDTASEKQSRQRPQIGNRRNITASNINAPLSKDSSMSKLGPQEPKKLQRTSFGGPESLPSSSANTVMGDLGNKKSQPADVRKAVDRDHELCATVGRLTKVVMAPQNTLYTTSMDHRKIDCKLMLGLLEKLELELEKVLDTDIVPRFRKSKAYLEIIHRSPDLVSRIVDAASNS